MCDKCNDKKDWMFCPYCGHELHKETQEDKPEMTQDKFDEIFLGMLRKANKVVWYNDAGEESDVPTCSFMLNNAAGKFMFNISLDSKPIFYYSYYRVYKVFNEQYDLDEDDIRRLMKKQLKLLFNMDGVTPLFGSVLDTP